jgi:hypothetical protein
MKLEDVQDGFLYATSGRDIFKKDLKDSYTYMGTFPNPESGINKLISNPNTHGFLAKLQRKFIGRLHNINLWPITEYKFIGNVGNFLFRSYDGGDTWGMINQLHPSSGIRGVLPNGLCYHEGTIYIGEYIFDKSRDPRVFSSYDFGESWQTEIILEDVRHVHAVQPDPFTDDIWITTGDRDSESKIGRLVDGSLEVLGTGSQMWRAVELVFTPEYLIWGTDCPYQDNHILRIHRDNLEKSPEPEVVHTVEEPFYYSTSVEIGDRTIILFSTGGGFGTDSTAPDSVSQETGGESRVSVFGGCSTTKFTQWSSLAEYNVRKKFTNRLGLHRLAANAYIFLASSPRQGIFINPINTVTNNGEILNVRAEVLEKNDLGSAFATL